MFEKVTEALNEANERYNLTNMKIDAYCESVFAQYEINCKKAELKVLQESGTDDDLWYLQEAAGKSVVESLKNAIKKIIDTFKKYVNEVKIKILSTITSKSSKEKVEKIDRKVKLNPFLSKKKVQVKDRKKIDAVFAWVKAEIRKLLALIKSGKELAKEKIQELKELFKRKLAQAIAIGSAMTTTAGVALGSVKKRIGDVAAKISKSDKETTDDIQAIEDAGGEKHEDSFGELQQLASLRSDVGKEEVNEIVDSVTGDLRIVGSAVTKSKDKSSESGEETSTEESVNDVEESLASEMEPSLSDYFGESEADLLLKEIESDLFNEGTETDDNQDDESVMNENSDDEFDFDFEF